MKGNFGQELLHHTAKRILTAHPCHPIQFLGLKKKLDFFFNIKKKSIMAKYGHSHLSSQHSEERDRRIAS